MSPSSLPLILVLALRLSLYLLSTTLRLCCCLTFTMSHSESSSFLAQLSTKTVIITGGAGGIGAATARVFNDHGANVVIADIPKSKENAEIVISSFPYPHKAIYVPVDITDWAQMTNMFRVTLDTFGGLDTVVANAGIMESTDALDIETTDSNGDLLPSTSAFSVIDVNLKGTLNSTSSCLFWFVYGYNNKKTNKLQHYDWQCTI